MKHKKNCQFLDVYGCEKLGELETMIRQSGGRNNTFATTQLSQATLVLSDIGCISFCHHLITMKARYTANKSGGPFYIEDIANTPH
eukprot:m.239700 g.239700  ORF g.239700 m.239700 type:complete len:86 (-) comp16071_c1_seq4:378-635(-)